LKLLADLGEACAEYQDSVLQELSCKVVEADEICSFCYAKQKNVPEQFKGTARRATATYGRSRRSVPIRSWPWLVGERTRDDAEIFLSDLASRMANRIQLSTDGPDL
jgi:hypothetical protein